MLSSALLGTKLNSSDLSSLCRWKITRTRVTIELYTFDIYVSVVFWTPKLEQDVLPRTVAIN